MANLLQDTLNTGVKFYSSLTREQALGQVPIGKDDKNIDIYVEPGAICFVSDNKGNSVFLNNKLFGDGAVASSSGGITEVKLEDLIILEKDGLTLKSLSDYFDANGSLITEELIVKKPNLTGDLVPFITINKDGIKIGEETVATLQYVAGAVSSNNATLLNNAALTAKDYADAALAEAKEYVDKINGSIFKVKGSVNSYEDLLSIEAPSAGDVYNVVSAHDNIPAGTNYVWVIEETSSYWDPLGGSIDLSGYQDSATVNLNIATALGLAKIYSDGKVTDLQNNTITPLQNSVSGIDLRVLENTNNLSIAAALVTTNTTNITNIATLLTWQ